MVNSTKYGVYIANFGVFDTPNDYIELAMKAEEHNWDGFFMWDHTVNQRGNPTSEPYTTLSAIATRTEKIKIGTTITGVPRHKPWILARQIATIDHISNGRFIFGIGLGVSEEYTTFNEIDDSIILKEKLEECLEIIQGLFTKKKFSYNGKHYQISDFKFQPKPIQTPLPIWVGGAWPNKGPMIRASKFQGVFPLKVGYEERLSPKDITDILNFIQSKRDTLNNFDVVYQVYTTGNEEEDAWIKEYSDAGVNWLVEVIYPGRGSKKEISNRIEKGPLRM